MRHAHMVIFWLVPLSLVLALSACTSIATLSPPTDAPPSTPVVEPATAPAETPTTEPTIEATTEPATEPSASGTVTSTLAPEMLAMINEYLSSVYDGAPFQGTVLVARGGEILLRQGYGMADESNGITNGPETKFRLGSLTKPFTAVVVLMLHEQGALNVDDPICSYLDDCPPAWQAITIHNLLAHTSGIPEITALPDFSTFKAEATTPVQTIARIIDLPLDFEPGEQWQYSNTNYIILSAIIERASGQSYEAFVEEHIFAPLGMVNSGYDHNDGQTAIGYLPDGSVAEFIDMTLPSGAGGLYSTVDDLYLFDRALYTEQLLPDELRERMFTLQAAIAPNDAHTGYGYGWVIVLDPDGPPPGKIVAHNGNIDGFSTAMLRLVELDTVVIALDNVEARQSIRVSEGLAQQIFSD